MKLEVECKDYHCRVSYLRLCIHAYGNWINDRDQNKATEAAGFFICTIARQRDIPGAHKHKSTCSLPCSLLVHVHCNKPDEFGAAGYGRQLWLEDRLSWTD